MILLMIAIYIGTIIPLSPTHTHLNTVLNLERLGLVWFMVFNTTFNNISVILWQSVLLVEETGIRGENH